jgi:hypothetical protein
MTVGQHEALWSPAEVAASWNLGGERLWLGPEADWFWKKTDAVDFGNYQVPPGFDPDEWKVTEKADGRCASERTLTLRCPHSGHFLDLLIRRRFDLLPGSSLQKSAGGIALQTTTALEVLQGTPGQRVDLWSILQLPFGGNLVLPVLGTPSPRDYFDPCPSSEMKQISGGFSLRIGGSSVFKIGLGPEQVVGRMAYVRPVKEGTLVLERSFPVHRALHYCDAPLDALETQGDAVQFFNDGGSYGCFGEMEHHSPSLVCGAGPQSLVESTITTARLLDAAGFSSWQHSAQFQLIP